MELGVLTLGIMTLIQSALKSCQTYSLTTYNSRYNIFRL